MAQKPTFAQQLRQNINSANSQQNALVEEVTQEKFTTKFRAHIALVRLSDTSEKGYYLTHLGYGIPLEMSPEARRTMQRDNLAFMDSLLKYAENIQAGQSAEFFTHTDENGFPTNNSLCISIRHSAPVAEDQVNDNLVETFSTIYGSL